MLVRLGGSAGRGENDVAARLDVGRVLILLGRVGKLFLLSVREHLPV
jgi:hypothetical protein